MSQFILLLGGKYHLTRTRPFVQYPEHEIKENGHRYVLKRMPEFGQRWFYVHEDLLDQPEYGAAFITHFLRHAFIEQFDDQSITNYAEWYQNIATFRTNRKSWVYLNSLAFFANLPNGLTLTAFRKAFAEFTFPKDESARLEALRAFAKLFPNTFFVTWPGMPRGYIEVIKRSMKPLAIDIYDDMFNLLQPKSLAEAELLALSLSFYCNSNSYLIAIAEGRPRIDLNGKEYAPPTDKQRIHAAKSLVQRHYHLPAHLVSLYSNDRP